MRPTPTHPPTAPSFSSNIARSLASATPTLTSVATSASALLVSCIDHVTPQQECSANSRCTDCAGEQERGAYVASLESVSDPATITGGVGTRGMPLGTGASPERIERPRWWPAGRRQGQGRKGRRKSNSSSNVRGTSANRPKRSNSSVELRVVDPPSILPSIRVPLQAAHPRGRCNRDRERPT